MSQPTIDLIGGGVFSAAALLFAGIFAVNAYSNACKWSKMASCNSKLLINASLSSLIVALAYWASFGGYGTAVRAGDGLTVQFGQILAWPFTFYLLGRSIGAYAHHSEYFSKVAALALSLAGVAHYLGVYIDTTTPGIQLAFYLTGLLSTLCAVFVAFVLRQRRDAAGVLALGVVAVVAGFYVSYLLAEYYLNILGGTSFSIYLLVANVVVYIVYYAVLLLTGCDTQKACRMD